MRIEVEYVKNVLKFEEIEKEIEAQMNSRLNFRAVVHLVPEGSLPRFEMKTLRAREIDSGLC